MKEIRGRLGIIYRAFEPGEIIVPPDTTEERDKFYSRQDLINKYLDWDEYILRHTWIVEKMISNNVTVVVRKLGESSNHEDQVSSSSYILATPKQIAAIVARRIQGITTIPGSKLLYTANADGRLIPIIPEYKK